MLLRDIDRVDVAEIHAELKARAFQVATRPMRRRSQFHTQPLTCFRVECAHRLSPFVPPGLQSLTKHRLLQRREVPLREHDEERAINAAEEQRIGRRLRFPFRFPENEVAGE